MPRQITQYRVFIGSPGGLEKEREAFQRRLDVCSKSHGAHKDVDFAPVGWKDTLAGPGRPQDLINRDLETCDYAVFVFHDRWGSSSGNGGKVGTEEEWELAERLYEAGKIYKIILFFKAVDPSKLTDPGDQLKSVLIFRERIEAERKYLLFDFTTLDEFRDHLDLQLADWLVSHDKRGNAALGIGLDGGPALAAAVRLIQPGFTFWLAEAKAARDVPSVMLYCAERALSLAESDIDWADARNIWGISKNYLCEYNDALIAFREIGSRFLSSRGVAERTRGAKSLRNLGLTFNALGRSEEAIAVFDDLIGRFADATEMPIRGQVAMALVNKGVTLGDLGRSEEELSTYDDVLARFADAIDVSVREQVATALVNKGVVLGKLGRTGEEISVYDEALARFSEATEPKIHKQIAKALYNKGVTFDELGRDDDAIGVYGDLVARFSNATDTSIREDMADALYNKGMKLRDLGRDVEAILVWDDISFRFGGDKALAHVVKRARDARNKLAKAAKSQKKRP